MQKSLMRGKAICIAVLATVAAWAQSAAPTVTFEVASIKPSPPPSGRGMRVGCPSDPGRITCSNMNMANLVTMAYGISSYQLSGLEYSMTDRYEVAVKIPEGATKEQIKLMWQNLLKERFKLAVHHEAKDAQVYELVVAKGGLKIQESVEPPPAPADAPPTPTPESGPRKPLALAPDGFPDIAPGGMAMMRGVARWRPVRISMQGVASMLGGQLGQPVTDATGLKGKYDFTLSWITGGGGGRGVAIAGQPGGESPLAGLDDSEAGPTLLEAVQRQLGLKLEQKKGTIDMLVVDHVERVPTDN
jgi:uncharacterized protein (TIGR03435 family)